ncbi:MAG: hypothetical protein ACT4P0_12110 [Panacagrimonas sp.]
MIPASRSPFLFWLAVFAWLAQAGMPAAHAAAMGRQEAGLATWCGVRSPAMAGKLAQLPDEVREILEKGMAQASQHQDCAQSCASAGPGLLPQAATVLLRAAGLEALAAPPARGAHRPFRAIPQPRGPPLKS